MRTATCTLLLLAALPLVALARSPEPRTASASVEANDYTFREPPVNALGVAGLADLRGKPVLIDFWGTR